MARRQQDFPMFQDEGKALAIDCTQEDGTTPLDLSGLSLVWKMGPDPSSPAITKTSSGGQIVVTDAPGSPSGSNDRAVVDLDPADTTSLAAGRYVHELRDDTNNDVLSAGRIQLEESVSK